MAATFLQVILFSVLSSLGCVLCLSDTQEGGDRFLLSDQDEESSQLLFDDLKKYGVVLVPTLYASTGWDVAGGLKRTKDGNLAYLADVNLQLLSDPILHFPGGTFCVDFQIRRGGQAHKDVGAYQSLFYIDSPNLTQLSEFWYKQAFQEERYWIKIGKNDSSIYFDYSLNAAYFQYQSFQNIPTIRNLPFYPNPAMGCVVYANPIKGLTWTMGLFDGSSVLGVQTGSLGITGKFFDHLHRHAFLIAEIATSWSLFTLLQGRMGIGGWHNTADVLRYSGGIGKGLQGWYAVIDQTLWRAQLERDPRQIGVFLQMGATSPETSPVKQVYAAGINWTGMIPYRPQDQWGLGICMNRFSLFPGSGYVKPTETAIETYYVYNPVRWMNIQPDLQYIITPGGRGTPNALALLLNMAVIF